jgi:adenylosuccinate synthase
MGVTAIVGLQWGDEGKGKIVDVVCEDADLVIRCQGGANAGHTVVANGRKFVLHLVPAGILRENATCLIGSGVVVDLDVLAAELEDLNAAGISTSGRLVISRRAHLVLPIHKDADRREEQSRGAGRIGTTLRGIGPCYSHKCDRLGIRVGDLLDQAVLDRRLSGLRHALGKAVNGAAPTGPSARQSGSARPDGAGLPDLDETYQYCRKHTAMVREMSGDAVSHALDALAANKNIVLEGAQGFLLDIDYGTYPYVTSSNTGVHGLASGSGLPPSSISKVVGVMKAYITRVGAGPLPTEMEEPYQSKVREKGSEFGATTGRPRRCGWLDMVALDYSCRANGVTSLAITKLDPLSGIDSLKVCVGYRVGDERVAAFPSEVDLLAKCVPQYEAGDTWESMGSPHRFEDLAEGAKRYLRRITSLARCKLGIVSVGPGRDDVIRLED